VGDDFIGKQVIGEVDLRAIGLSTRSLRLVTRWLKEPLPVTTELIRVRRSAVGLNFGDFRTTIPVWVAMISRSGRIGFERSGCGLSSAMPFILINGFGVS
jgi:hypothetical protein